MYLFLKPCRIGLSGSYVFNRKPLCAANLCVAVIPAVKGISVICCRNKGCMSAHQHVTAARNRTAVTCLSSYCIVNLFNKRYRSVIRCPIVVSQIGSCTDYVGLYVCFRGKYSSQCTYRSIRQGCVCPAISENKACNRNITGKKPHIACFGNCNIKSAQVKLFKFL